MKVRVQKAKEMLARVFTDDEIGLIANAIRTHVSELDKLAKKEKKTLRNREPSEDVRTELYVLTGSEDANKAEAIPAVIHCFQPMSLQDIQDLEARQTDIEDAIAENGDPLDPVATQEPEEDQEEDQEPEPEEDDDDVIEAELIPREEQRALPPAIAALEEEGDGARPVVGETSEGHLVGESAEALAAADEADGEARPVPEGDGTMMRLQEPLDHVIDHPAECIVCGCSDFDACLLTTDEGEVPCGWVTLWRDTGYGVCSNPDCQEAGEGEWRQYRWLVTTPATGQGFQSAMAKASDRTLECALTALEDAHAAGDGKEGLETALAMMEGAIDAIQEEQLEREERADPQNGADPRDPNRIMIAGRELERGQKIKYDGDLVPTFEVGVFTSERVAIMWNGVELCRIPVHQLERAEDAGEFYADRYGDAWIIHDTFIVELHRNGRAEAVAQAEEG